MSAIITGRVFWTEFKELSYTGKNSKIVNIKETTAKIVMLAIADSTDDFGENSWQSFETIATKASIERRSAIRVVRALVKHGYLTIAGITKYGTNNFTVNKDVLGQPPAKRARLGRPKTSDPETKTSDPETKTSDSDAKTSDPQSPDPLINPPEPSFNLKGASLDWILSHGGTPTEAELRLAQLREEAPKMFEKCLGFGTLPWGSNALWKKFEKFVTEIYVQDDIAFGNYLAWRGGKGKYKAMSNKQIRMNPQVFMDTGWAEFLMDDRPAPSTSQPQLTDAELAAAREDAKKLFGVAK